MQTYFLIKSNGEYVSNGVKLGSMAVKGWIEGSGHMLKIKICVVMMMWANKPVVDMERLGFFRQRIDFKGQSLYFP